MRTINAENITKELVKFSRVGIPKEILTDQGSNFVSQLLTEIYRLLHIHPIRTTPYHPQNRRTHREVQLDIKIIAPESCCGCREGLGQTVTIPHVRVPRSPTGLLGFSPFEPLYGRAVRGPLDILRKTWQTDHRTDGSVLSHVLAMREKVAHMTKLVEKNLKQTQKQQKRRYDRTAIEQEFQMGWVTRCLCYTPHGDQQVTC